MSFLQYLCAPETLVLRIVYLVGVLVGVSVATTGARGATTAPEVQNTLIKQYCAGCHSDKLRTGGLTLEQFDVTRATEKAEIAENVIRKLRAGMMPPPGMKRPGPDSIWGLVDYLETRIDAAAAAHPNPGRRTFQRLNRAEYARSIRDLLAIDIDADALLPPDTVSHNFDNIADVQTLSPTLMESYLRAARQVSLEAVGSPKATHAEATYKVPRTASQMVHVEGTPLGTRGGIFVMYNFPADGDYRFKVMLHGTLGGVVFGATAIAEQIDISVNGRRVALLDVDPKMSDSDANGLTLLTPPIRISAGPQRVSAAFIQHGDGPVDDLMAPVAHTLADSQIGDAFGITVLPHLRELTISGPDNVTGLSETPSRRKIFTCRPKATDDETSCAKRIVSRMATEAYRQPVDEKRVGSLIKFYELGRTQGDFESGIRLAIEAILASPHFVFRLEKEPAGVRPGESYRLTDLELASRLSYFLWASVPDAELVKVAAQGQLKNPLVLDKQVRRMIADPRSEALATRFAAQWVRLQDLEKLHPDALLYPQYDERLGEAMRRETELFFEAIVREDRSVLDLIDADFTFVNERLARHYGIPNVSGPHFRKVEITDPNRRGLLGQGSILTLTSVATRTSPVQRGKWVLEVLLGSPPPPPPPNVPPLDDTKDVAGSRTLSVRERMEEHRHNPSCNSCHRVIDPVGLALENFDATGAWRVKDNGVKIDARGELYDGTDLDGPSGLRQALLKHSDVIVRTFTENLMAYALGRRIEYYDMPTVRAVVHSAARADNRFSAFVLGIVNSLPFQTSEAAPKEGIRTASR